MPHRRPGDEQKQQHEPVDRARVRRGEVIRQHDEQHRKRHVAVVYGALLCLLPQCEIRRPARAGGVDHLSLRRDDPLPHVGDHDRSEQGADVHERGATGQETAQEDRDAGEEREGNRRRDGWTAGQRRPPQAVVYRPAEDHDGDAQRDGGAPADAGDSRIEEVRAAEIEDQHEQGDAADPGEHRFPLEPVQHSRHLPGPRTALLDLVEAPAVHHPEVAFDPRLWLFGSR